MSRLFNGSSDFITFTAGTLGNLPVGAFSVAFIWRPNNSHRGGLFDGRDGTNTRQMGINPFDSNGGEVFISLSAFDKVAYSSYLNNFAILGFSRTAAGAVVRVHYSVYGSGVWTHTDLTALGAKTAITSFLVGSFDPTQFLNGYLAVSGFWVGRALTDLNFESLKAGLSGWVAQSPDALHVYNDNPINDRTGNGANQTAITGTTIDLGVEPPGFSYSTGVIMGWLPQTYGHIQVFYVSGSKVKVRPGIITSIVSGNTVNAKVGHTSQTFASLVRRTNPTSPPALPYYIAM